MRVRFVCGSIYIDTTITYVHLTSVKRTYISALKNQITMKQSTTKLIMTLSAVFLAVIGISLTFLPAEIGGITGIAPDKTFTVILQLLGALYFSFAMLNWMAKGTLIGGIYGKPVSIANLTHFVIGALALTKLLLN